jgi:hypothetical protein
LRFVDQHAINRGCGMGRQDMGLNVIFGFDEIRACGQTDARRNFVSYFGARINGRFEQKRAHAALIVVIGRLQEDRRFASIHRRVIKVKFGHVMQFRFAVTMQNRP